VSSGLPRRSDYRGRTGVASYDHARWLAPPPATTAPIALSGRVDALLQRGGSAEPGRVQEVIVDPPGRDVLVLFPDGAHWYEGHVEGRHVPSPGTPCLFAIPADARTRWVTRPTTSRVIHLHVPAAAGEHLFGRAPREFGTGFRETSPRARRLMYALSAVLARGPSLSLYADECVTDLLAECGALPSCEPPRSAKLAHWQLVRIIELMAAQLGEPLTLARLAGEVSLSSYHFCRAFKATAGVTPMARLTEMRLARACEQLASTSRGVAAIGASVGYPDPGYFARLFKRQLGVSPHAMRSRVGARRYPRRVN
jgi:AraC-like DNA-binding protein